MDDHEIVRMGVRILFSDTNLWEICGEAKDGAEAVQKVKEQSPDVVILDLTMPTMGGFETAKRIRQVAPSTRIVFFRIHEMPTTARLAGADAFVLKSSAAQDLTRAIYQVLEGPDIHRPSTAQNLGEPANRQSTSPDSSDSVLRIHARDPVGGWPHDPLARLSTLDFHLCFALSV